MRDRRGSVEIEGLFGGAAAEKLVMALKELLVGLEPSGIIRSFLSQGELRRLGGYRSMRPRGSGGYM